MIVRSLLTTTNNLCMPTHTYCYPAVQGGVAPLFDPLVTPSRVGVLTEHFWRSDGVQRSLHPSHSVAAIGPFADVLTSHHEECITPCGKGTPYIRMIEADFSVLMLGASLNAYTFFHTAEDEAGVPYLYYAEPFDLRLLNRERRELTIRMKRQDMTIARRFIEMDKELEAEGLLKRVALGTGELMCIPSSKEAHRFIVDLLRRDPYHLVQRH